MKNIIRTILIATSLFACKKRDTPQTGSDFVGSWQFEKFSGYPSNGFTLGAYGNIITIGADGGFERRQDDSLLFKGSYYLEEKKDCSGEEKKFFFSTSDSVYLGTSVISRSGDELFLSTSNCAMDGGTSTYRRK